ncbi:hypothetical protein [Dendronalium sp. ChiSLP03b]|uniref:hypothetical protein n=1 Tax=Dendronalium sp. ChiSLP03b TaxID=3075381 RepID=UPI002AD445EC|nr:hypothetical protein [Dendronalium sp. ChiSLP03b]MDZ8205188.1 hypothetical protein [Dendronalium sp. ChiSLP03b]
MTNPRPLQVREQNLIDLYSHCQLGMTPKNFYAKWDVNHEAIACTYRVGQIGKAIAPFLYRLKAYFG